MKYIIILFMVVFFGCKRGKVAVVLPPTICGCKDSTALNFNKNASKDDGSCKHEYDEIIGTWKVNGTNEEEKSYFDINSGKYVTTKTSNPFSEMIEITKYGKDLTSVRITGDNVVWHDSTLNYKNHKISFDTSVPNATLGLHITLTVKDFIEFERHTWAGIPYAQDITATGIRVK